MSERSDQPLTGRRFYFVGIGGAGLSAYANVARAWGAEVRGWDVRETVFMDTLDGVEIETGGEPGPPAGYEVVLSTAHLGRVEGVPREVFLAELVSLRPSIVVTGAHGKTTTSAMIAFVLRELGRDPAWIIGGVVPQLGGNAGVGAGYLVVEGDESDRSVGRLQPEIAVITNVELDHHAAYASEAELGAFLDAWSRSATHVVRGWELEPSTLSLAVPGDHNRSNAAAALAALEHAGIAVADAAPVLERFAGVDRRFQHVGDAAGVSVYDDYGHNPTEIAATLRAARECSEGRLIAVYQPHVVERTRQLHRELGSALGLADAAVVTEITSARDAPREGITGRLVVKALPEGIRAGWAPTYDDAVAITTAWARSGDLVITFGVGEPWKLAQAILQRLGARS